MIVVKAGGGEGLDMTTVVADVAELVAKLKNEAKVL